MGFQDVLNWWGGVEVDFILYGEEGISSILAIYIRFIVLLSVVFAESHAEILTKSLQIALFHEPAIGGPDKSLGHSKFIPGYFVCQFPVITQYHFFIKTAQLIEF